MTRVAAFLQPGWADWEIGPVASVLRFHVGCELATYSPDGADVVSVGGLKLDPDGSFADPQAASADILLLIGSDAWVKYEDETFARMIRDHLEAGRTLGVICAGTAFAARNGLFEHRKHTSNGREWLLNAAPDYPGLGGYVDTSKAVVDGTLVSAPGSAPQTFAAELMRLAAPDKEKAARDYLALAAAEFSP